MNLKKSAAPVKKRDAKPPHEEQIQKNQATPEIFSPDKNMIVFRWFGQTGSVTVPSVFASLLSSERDNGNDQKKRHQKHQQYD